MAPVRKTKEEIVAMLADGMPAPVPAMEPLRAADIVTYPALGAVLAAPLQKIDNLKELMLEKFHSLERLSHERHSQIEELKEALDREKSSNVKFKVTSLVAIVGFLAEAVFLLATRT